MVHRLLPDRSETQAPSILRLHPLLGSQRPRRSASNWVGERMSPARERLLQTKFATLRGHYLRLHPIGWNTSHDALPSPPPPPAREAGKRLGVLPGKRREGGCWCLLASTVRKGTLAGACMQCVDQGRPKKQERGPRPSVHCKERA